MDFKSRSKIIISFLKRLAPYVEQEVRELGFPINYSFSSGIETEGSLNDCIRLNLNLRCASQVRFSLKWFEAHHPDDVYRNLLLIDWENIIASDGYFSVTNSVDHPTVTNTMFINVRVKDAIVDRLREKTDSRPNSGSELTGAVIHLHWRNDEAEVFIDTSGETLAKHGYRKIPGKAPMLEALASAIIMASKWDRKSPFVNPMCGSGTLAIEAALIATDRRPGLLRENYAFMHIKGYEEQAYQQELSAIRAKVKEIPELKIIASDNRQDAVEISAVNAELAGVDSLVEFSLCDFADSLIPETPGVLFINPEYGERMGEIEELEGTYARIGDFMKKKCQGWMGYIFTGNLDLAKKIGLKANRRIEFYTAQLDCRLLEYELYGGTRRTTEPKRVRD
jgi:putative N6-adenine-specific DNA methylase